MSVLCVSFPRETPFARRLAAALGATHAELDIHRFPDGETLVRLPGECAQRNVIMVCGGNDPNASALPMYFAAHAARAQGAASVGLVAPYLAYMRQDTQFHPGEAVSALAYGRFLSGVFDWIATVDPHLHRLETLEAAFSIPALCVSSMPAVSDWIAANVENPVLIGPDRESTQWVEHVARRLGAPWTVLDKTRTGDREVSVKLAEPAIVRGRAAVIVDDIASSGRTLAQTLGLLRGLGCGAATCVIVHALFAADSETVIRAAGAARIVSTNTVTHATNAIDVVPLLAGPIRALLEALNPRAAAR